MSDSTKLMAQLARTALSGMFFRQMLSGVAAVLVLGTMAGIFAGAAVIGLFYAAYAVLIEHGISMDMSFLILSSTALLVVIALLAVMRHRVRKHTSIAPKITSQVDKILHAFAEGFSEPTRHDKP